MAKQRNATDVTIKKLEIYASTGSYNLEPHLLELNIYENIFKSFLSANIVLTDSHNIPYKLPIVGEETIDVDIVLSGYDGVGDEEKHSIVPPRLHVNSLTDRYFTKPKAQAFTLSCVSEKCMSSQHSKVSKSYNGKTISFIVDDIFFNYLFDGDRGLFFEPTDRIENIIIPNLTPIQAIQWLAKRATKKDGNGVNYLYYETMDESHFVSLDTLIGAEPRVKFMHRPRVDDPTGTSFISEDIFKIEKFYFTKNFDKIENTKKGMYSSKLITHDITTKTIQQHEYNGFNDWFGLNHCGIYPPISNSDMELKIADVPRKSHAPIDEPVNQPNLGWMVDSKVDFFPKHQNMYSTNANEIYNNKVEQWKQQRSAHIQHMEGTTIVFDVSGNSSLRVGETITLILPSPETTDKDKKSDVGDDKFLSGKFLVTSIRHIFSRTDSTDPKVTYTMKVEATKDGYEQLVPVREARDRED